MSRSGIWPPAPLSWPWQFPPATSLGIWLEKTCAFANSEIAGDGRDPIISQDVAEPQFTLPRTPQALHLTLQRWVITTGGDYFFSPSIAAINQLAGTS